MSRTFTVTEEGNLDRIVLMQATLRALHWLGGSGSLHDIYSAVLILEEVPPEEANILSSNGKPKLRYGLDWSRTMLKHVGLVINPKLGIWELTAAGRAEYTYADLKAMRQVNLEEYNKPKSYDVQTETSSNSEQLAEVPQEYVPVEPGEVWESILMQAKIAEIGAQMLDRFDIWVPSADRAKVKEHVNVDLHGRFREQLGLAYDTKTLGPIRQIDVLWLKGNAIVRAFEIEHTTAVYSGLLRMADLLALQPNINIKLHIVAPDHRKSKVLDEINRPAFLPYRLPLVCSFIPYSGVNKLAALPHLAHVSDAVIGEYEVKAQG